MIPNKNKIYTYKDYLTFPDDERVEIIEGELYNMASPSVVHQSLSMEISYSLKHYIKSNNGDCKVLTAPFDVVFTNDDEEVEESSNVVIPDISVICDKNKLSDGKKCVGSPDMIVEIVSPSNSGHDYVTKLNLYQKYKVKEYWIVSPKSKKILVYILNDKGFYDEPMFYTFNDKVKVNIYDDLEIDFSTFDL
ncbi:MAG: Uma2 family endonuclease [Clostridium sp.]|nr:Uma2 family endonuclease [Clostridium sp.]